MPGRSWQALAHTVISLLPALTVADFGAGEGTLSQLLAKTARKVIAIDNSPKMVEFGSKLAKRHGLAILNIDSAISKIRQSQRHDRSRDSQPGAASRDPSRARDRERLSNLRKGGRIVILDLLSHRFERARNFTPIIGSVSAKCSFTSFSKPTGFTNIEVTVVSREKQSPHFQTVFATGVK